MRHGDLRYLRRRAADEATSAVRAADPRAAALHAELADGYARQIEQLKAEQADTNDEGAS